MRIGFTGTRAGMTAAQRQRVAVLVDQYQPSEVHIGDCVGADAEFHAICRPRVERLVGHPPADGRERAFCGYDTLLAPRPTRNHDIVDAAELLVAAPREYVSVPRGSATWATIRYARTRRVPVIIVWPDGSEVLER